MFKEFELKDVFETQPFRGGLQVPTGALMKSDELEEGSTPRITVTSDNNGIGGYYKDVDNKNYRTFENCISVSFLGTVFYHPYKASFDMKVHCLKPLKHELVETEALYIIPTLRKKLAGNDYFTQTTSTDLPYMTMLFPVIENSNPDHEYTVDDIDWQYMRDYITELERDRITELDAYLQATGLNDYELTEDDKKILSLSAKRASDKNGTLEDDSEDEVKFGKFIIGEIFDSQNGDTDLQKIDVNGKGVPIITSGIQNNGILGLSDRKAKVINANTITVDMFGNAYYRDFAYKMVTHARVFSLKLKEGILTDGVGLYICSKLKHLTELFSYNNMCSFNKIKSLSIELPIKSDGTPDFDYMERYIRAIEKVVIADVVKYKDKVIEETRKAR
jgi:hypothetical protein